MRSDARPRTDVVSRSTWIIIILIIVACLVACGEISARLLLHGRGASARALVRQARLLERVAPSAPQLLLE